MGVGPVGSGDRQLCLSPTATSCLINTPVLLGPLPLSRWGSRWLVCHSHNCWVCVSLSLPFCICCLWASWILFQGSEKMLGDHWLFPSLSSR